MKIEVDILELLLPNILTILVQLCATLVLFLLLKKLAWTPVRNMMQKRADYEQGKLAEADAKLKEADAFREEAEGSISAAKEEAKKIVESGRKEGQKIKEEMIEEANREKEELTQKAHKEIQKEREEMEEEIHKQIVDVAMVAAEKLLNEKMDEEKDRKFIEDFLKEN